MGAWIETIVPTTVHKRESRSHPIWVRGLKLMFYKVLQLCKQSHPIWVRGLKLGVNPPTMQQPKSHPIWVRGLKRPLHIVNKYTGESHPIWVRGLKPILCLFLYNLTQVAPYMGAWIET